MYTFLFPILVDFAFPPKISDFSSRPWRNLPPTWVIHMATRRPAHNTPIHMDLGPFLKKTMQEVHVDRRVVGWSAHRYVDHPCGWPFSPWLARKATEKSKDRKEHCGVAMLPWKSHTSQGNTSDVWERFDQGPL